MTAALKAHFAMCRAALDDAEVAALNNVRTDDDGLTAVGKLVRTLVIEADRAAYSRTIAEAARDELRAERDKANAENTRLSRRVADLERLDDRLGGVVRQRAALKQRVGELMDLVDEGDRDFKAALVLLCRVSKYCREDRAETPGSTRLARLVVSIDRVLALHLDEVPADHIGDALLHDLTDPVRDEGDTATKPVDVSHAGLPMPTTPRLVVGDDSVAFFGSVAAVIDTAFGPKDGGL